MAFCNITGSCPVPASVETVCRYAALLARSLKFSSVRQYLNIIRLLHLEAGESNPLDCYLVQSVLKGLRTQLGDRVIRKLPISHSLLLNILSSLNLDNVFHSAMWAAGLLMFFCMLRRANVLVSSLRCFNVAKHLRRCDISFFHWGAMITIRWTKTIQYQQRVLRMDGPIFMYPGARGLVPLSPDNFIKDTRFYQACTPRIKQGGVDNSAFAGHSFRRGGGGLVGLIMLGLALTLFAKSEIGSLILIPNIS